MTPEIGKAYAELSILSHSASYVYTLLKWPPRFGALPLTGTDNSVSGQQNESYPVYSGLNPQS